jgi:hypothetical protein
VITIGIDREPKLLDLLATDARPARLPSGSACPARRWQPKTPPLRQAPEGRRTKASCARGTVPSTPQSSVELAVNLPTSWPSHSC